MKKAERVELAKKRIMSVAGRHIAISSRTLEHKISDGGPYNQRIDPHVLTPARNELVNNGDLELLHSHNIDWYLLKNTDKDKALERIEFQGSLHSEATTQDVSRKVGQALEIAVQRAMSDAGVDFLGAFTDIDEHDDSILFTKEEPPSTMSGRIIPGKQKLDFLVQSHGLWSGIEVKNIRPWIYPNSEEVRSLIQKSLYLDIVPALVARRIPFVTNKILRMAGGITWETLRQRYPESESTLVAKIRHKESLGYSDIVLGNHADNPLVTFFGEILPRTLETQREKFEKNHDLLLSYSRGQINYQEFAARLRRRADGTNEDFDDDDIHGIPF